jgi:hypothetical protein
MLGCSIIVLGVCLRKVFAAALMLALSASLLLIGGTAAKYYMNNRTTGQIDYHHTEANGATTATNGSQPSHPSQATSVPPKTDLNHAKVIVYPKGNQNKTASTNISVVPNDVVVSANQTFSVDVWINNVTDMAGWGIDLLWNSSVLKCVQAQVNTPPEWGGVGFDWFNKTESDANKIDPNSVYTAWQFGPGIINDYDASYGQFCDNYNAMCGLYEKGECQGPNGSAYENTFNGSLAIVTLTFQAVHAGSTSLDFGYVLIGNALPAPITSVVFNGFVEVP